MGGAEESLIGVGIRSKVSLLFQTIKSGVREASFLSRASESAIVGMTAMEPSITVAWNQVNF